MKKAKTEKMKTETENKESSVQFFHPCNPPTSTAQERNWYGKGKSALKPAARLARARLKAIVELYAPEAPLTGAIYAFVRWTFPHTAESKKRAQGLVSPKITAPDTHNLSKFLFDVMAETGYFEAGDQQVCTETIVKCHGDAPGICVILIGGQVSGCPFFDGREV